jgi:hypothetical protein
MAGGIASFPSGVQVFGIPATSAITTNSRVTTSMGPVMLVTDVVQFGPFPGTWLVPNQRVFVNGVPTIGQTSVGAMNFLGTPVPMSVVQTDGRVSAM